MIFSNVWRSILIKKSLYILIYLLTSSVLYADFSFSTLRNEDRRYREIMGYDDIILKNFYTDELIQVHGFSIIDPEVFISYNTTYAYGYNDRVAHQGKGFNISIITGLTYVSENIKVRIAPELFFSQNSDFDIVETPYSSGFGDYWTEFDNLQRYGSDSFYLLSAGQSMISLDFYNMKLKAGSENIVTGYAKRHSFLLSGHADGFPHIDFGTDNSLSIPYFGDVDVKMMWGRLEESEFFDTDDTNNYAWISGMFAEYSPFFAKNLSIGFNHLYTKPLNDWEYMDLFTGIPFVDNSNSGVDLKDMMISVAFRWVFPESNMELYGEWARNDNFKGLFDILAYPEHTQGYTIGFSTILANFPDDSNLQLSSEYSNSMQQRTLEVRPAGPWYRHAWAGWTQGYTNSGEVLGLAIGPGAESLWLEFKWIRDSGAFFAFTAERIVIDKDYTYYLRDNQDVWYEEGLIPSNDYYNVPFYVNLGLSCLIPVNDYDIYFNFLNNIGYDKNFIEMNHDYNVHFELGLSLDL